MRAFNKNKGFTLIELLLVIVIIGLMLAVIVPRAWRANIDTKYGLVRQNSSELASWSQEWAEKGILAQNEATSTATLANYFGSLTGTNSGLPVAGNPKGGTWVAEQRTNNWNDDGAPVSITGRDIAGLTDQPPEDAVEEIVPPDKIPRNPFNGVSVFEVPNDPETQGNAVTGALLCGAVGETVGGWVYFAFVFQGTDSVSNSRFAPDAFHAGQASQTLQGLRNGTFVSRLR